MRASHYTLKDPHMTLTDLEAALDSGQLQVQMANGRWWTLRRNGKTRTWPSRPYDYRIPVVAGLRAYGQLSPNSGLTLRTASPDASPDASRLNEKSHS